MFKQISIAVLCLLLTVLTAQGVERFVDDTGGDDARSCTTIQTVGTPAASIRKCASCSTVAGDICTVATGTQTLNLDSNVTTLVNGTVASPMIIRAAVGATVLWKPTAATASVVNFANTDYWTIDGVGTGRSNLVLDGTNLGAGASGVYVVHQGTGSTGLKLANLTIQHARNSGTSSGIGISSQSQVATACASPGETITIDNVLVDDTKLSHGMYLSWDCGWVKNSEVRNTDGVGIQSNCSTCTEPKIGTVIERNLIHATGRDPASDSGAAIAVTNHQADYRIQNNIAYGPLNANEPGIQIYGPQNTGGKVYHNTVVGYQGGIRMGPFTDLQTVDVANNLFYNNTECAHAYAPSNDAADNNVFRNNLCWKSSGAYSTPVQGTTSDWTISGTISADPKLANVGAANFHLLPTSGAIDAGGTVTGVTDDFYGTTRTGDDPDVGAVADEPTVSPLHLAFVSPPQSGSIINVALPNIVVEVVDAANTRQTSETGNCVLTVTAGTDTSPGGTLTRAVTSGLCTFDNITFDTADNDYVIHIAKSGGTAATAVDSAEFTVVTAAAAAEPLTTLYLTVP